jgi:F0F1-type ATP synthase assembly protein I
MFIEGGTKMFNARSQSDKNARRMLGKKAMVFILAAVVVAVAAIPTLALGNSPTGGGH